MLKTVAVLAICLAAQAGLAQDAAVADKAPVADQSSENATSPAAVAAADKDNREFKPPRGFQTKKRGSLVLYCKRDTTVGTRFKTESCYNEEQMRAYMLALEVQKNDVDRIRATCGGGTMCNPPDPTRN